MARSFILVISVYQRQRPFAPVACARYHTAFCLYFQKSFHTSNNAPIYATYTYINHCKESDMTIFLIIRLQYLWRRNWDSDPGTTLRCLRFSRPLHSTTLPLRHNNEFPVPQKSFARFESYAIKAALGKGLSATTVCRFGNSNGTRGDRTQKS